MVPWESYCKEEAPPGTNAGECMTKIQPVIMCGCSGTRVWPE